jgi:hypothetical protein
MVTSGAGRAQKFYIPRPPRGNSHTLFPFSLPKVANTQIQSFFLQESFSQSSSFKKSVLSLSKRSPPHTLLLPSGAAPPPLALFFFLQAHLPSPSYYAEDGGGHLGEETEACCLNGALQRRGRGGQQ